MTKLVILVAFVLLLWLAFRRARAVFLASSRGRELSALWRLLRQVRDHASPVDTSRQSSSSRRSGAPGGSQHPTRLVRCSACGTYVPESRTLYRAGALVFCSEDCERRAEAR